MKWPSDVKGGAPESPLPADWRDGSLQASKWPPHAWGLLWRLTNFHPDYILPLGRYKTASGFYNHLETIHTEKKTHFFSLQLPRHTPDREKQLFDLFICLCRSVPENWVVQTEDKLAVRPSVGLCVANGYSLRSSLLLLENIMEGLIFKYLCHIFKEQRFEAKEFWRVQYMVY